MYTWKSATHYRLWTMGLNGKERQRIIDTANDRMWDPINLALAIVSQNKIQLDSLQITIPPMSVYEHIWYEIVSIARWLWSWIVWLAEDAGNTIIEFLKLKEDQ